MKQNEYDFIIIGAGTAGSVLAGRLSENPENRVLVIEAGPGDRSIFINMPAAFSEPLKSDRLNWGYYSEPEPAMNNRRMYCPRGRVIGGSSSINGMVYIRGHALDYERWAKNGLPDWSYSHCLPYFRKAQRHEFGTNPYRGGTGPVHVTAGRAKHILHSAWIEAGQQAGYEYSHDVNGYRQEGIGPFDRTVWNGRRCSAARAYLHPAMNRDNLDIISKCKARRILFENKKAVGVEFSQKGKVNTVRASKEVILSGGAINSPQLLQLSGIGPADRLKNLDIPVVADLPGVGENLRDHLEVYVQYESKQPVSLYPSLQPLGRVKVGLEWIFSKTGPGATNHFETGGFVRTKPGVRHPNIQYHFLPLAISYDGSIPPVGHGFQVHAGPMRPTAKGYVRIRSNDPDDHPEILFNYMGTENDREEMRDGIRLAREIIAQKAFDRYRGKELTPGPEAKTDDEIDAYVREKGESAYHPTCTCKMGSDNDPEAVVNNEGQVYGVENLRVADASIMPDLISGNTDTPTVMIAEKLSDSIAGKEPLNPSDAPFFEHPEWESKQR